MVYYIEQVEGKKADAARALWEAVHAGDYQKAIDIYTAECGELPEHLLNDPTGSCWWKYNAPRAIKTNHDVFKQANNKYGRAILCEQKWAFEKMAEMAERKHGGKWEVAYEY